MAVHAASTQLPVHIFGLSQTLKTEPPPKKRPQINIKIYLQPAFETTSGYSTHETSSITANSISISLDGFQMI